MACPRIRSTRSSRRCGTNGTGSPRPAASISRKRMGSYDLWACRHGPTSWLVKWFACSLRQFTSHGFPTGPTGSGKGEGDTSDCFGSFDHEILLGILAEKIQDRRFLRLIRNMLKAGYLQDWEYHDTLSGCPQGGVVSPILSNIYLDKFDKFVEQELIPQYTRGALRAANPAYRQTDALLRRARRRGDRAQARHLMKQMRMLPSTDPMDPGYRRLRYVRYADDHLLGFTGPRAEAEQIKARLAEFLRQTLGLELNDSKTLISHARTQPARFLGYDIIVQHSSTKITRN